MAQRLDMPVAEVQPPLIGGRYRIERQLGMGGMARVWQVHDCVQDRALALKRLSRQAQRKHLALFEREYHTLTSLHHPNIVRVYDYASDDEGPYYTMELLHGGDVSDWKPRPWREVCRMLRELASALALVHARRYLHRDISTRNVWLTPDGLIKLIDFGTLVPFGKSRNVAGTPPFVAPEALYGAELDQRTDLYALGALGYWLLTGMHAFPARALGSLSELWQERPAAASARVAGLARADLPELPEALDVLLDGLLAIDPGARPNSAAAVIDSLCAFADLPAETHVLVGQSYLKTPALVARRRELQLLTDAFERAQAGRSGSVLIEAVSGSGRSRLLHELALRARMASAAVLQVQSDGEPTTHAVAEEFARKLLDALPEAARAAAAPHATTLAHLSPALREALGVPEHLLAELPKTHGEAGLRVRTALCDWFLEVARKHCLVLMIDDLHAVDAGSAAWLAALSREAGDQRFLLVATLREGAPRGDAVEGLRRHATLMGLAPLTAADTDAMLQSIFGTVQHVARLADAVHQRCEGNPGHTLDLLEHLVELGSVRYADGEWDLPLTIVYDRLPLDADEVVAARLRRLSPEARQLGQVLSVCEGLIGFELCSALSERSSAETYEALEALVRERVLFGSTEGYRFAREGVRLALLRGLDDARKQRAHRRSGELLLASEALTPRDRLRAGVHLLLGREVERGTAEVAAAALHYALFDLADLGPVAPLLEQALALFLELGRPRHELLSLYAPLALAGYYWERQYSTRYAETTLTLLQDLLGLTRARQLRPMLGHKLSLAVGLGSAFVEFRAHASNPRVPNFRQAMMLLFYCAAASTGVCVVCMDVKRAERYADVLEPLRALGPNHVATLMHDFSLNLASTVSDRMGESRVRWQRMIERLENGKPIRDLPPEVHILYLAGALYACGAIEALRDSGKALEFAERLEAFKLKLYELSAHQIRTVYYAQQGKVELAEQYRKRVETLAIQRGTAWQVETWTFSAMSAAYMRMNNVSGMKYSAQQLKRLSQDVPSLERVARRVQGGYLVLRGAPAEAVPLLENQDPPLVYAGWGRNRGQLARALNLLGEHARARQICSEALAQLSAADLEFTAMNVGVEAELALAESGLGNHALAASMLEQLIRKHGKQAGVLTMGELHEASVQVAADMRDQAALEHHITCLAHWRGQTGDRALIARAARIAKLARGAVRGAADSGVKRGDAGPDTHARTLIHRVRHGGERSLEGSAEWIMEQLGTFADIREGHVFVWNGEELECIASRGELPDAQEFTAWATGRLGDDIDDDVTVHTGVQGASEDRDRIVVQSRSYRLIRLFRSGTHDDGPVGALLLSDEARFQIPGKLLYVIAERLHGTQTTEA